MNTNLNVIDFGIVMLDIIKIIITISIMVITGNLVD